jgi:hypothetical protein
MCTAWDWGSLSQEDRRGYRGEIQAYDQNNRSMLHVRGDVFYDNDLGVPKAPFPMGTFSMQNLTAEDEEMDDEENLEDSESIVYPNKPTTLKGADIIKQTLTLKQLL